ncbi:MAG TPA: hypothetical protein VEH79_02285 [Gaiellaceae bacterium]|nr:hypothetical protein [Gaiellaceae bacterium]
MRGGESIARRRLVAVVAAALCLIGSATVAGADSGPPVGAPALAAMALSVDDLRPGASVQHQGYTKQPDFTLYYRREFKPGASLGRSRLLVLDSEVGLEDTAAAATTAAASVETVLRTRKGRLALARAALEDAGLSLTGLRLGSTGVRTLRAGDDAFALPLTVLLPRHVRLGIVLELVRVDRVIQLLYLVGQVDTKVVGSEAARLVGVAADHMVGALVPAQVVPPVVPGAPRVGLPSTADPGSWTNAPSSFAVQWLRCDSVGANCATIDGATGPTYVPGAADAGSTLEVSVVAANAVGSSQPSLSAPSAAVLATSA